MVCNDSTTQQICANAGLGKLQTLLNNDTVVSMLVVDSTVQLASINSSSNSSTSTNCTVPCLTCTVSGGNICVSCAQGLIVSNNTCLNQSCPILYCSSCISNLCVVCMPTFMLINGNCICQNNFKVNIFNSPASTCLCSLANNSCVFC